MHRKSNTKMRIVIEIGAGGDDPIDEACFDERNKSGNTKSGRCQRSRQGKTDCDFRLEHFLREQLASFAQPPGVIGKKRFVN